MAILNADFDLAALLLGLRRRSERARPARSSAARGRLVAPAGRTAGLRDERRGSAAVPRPRGKLSHLDMAKKLLAAGADPNAPITWGDRRFGSGGLARNPVNLNIGRHYLTYQGATPFYLAARNGDDR
jgi:hypothetical protein